MIPSGRLKSIALDVSRFPLPLVAVAVPLMVTCLVVLGLQAPPVPVLVTADEEFHVGLDRYVELRQRIESTMASGRVTNNAAEILGRQRQLGAAIQAARPDRRQGEIFTRTAGDDFHRIIARDRTHRSAVDRAAIMAEVPEWSRRVNDRYPAGSPLATFPPLLLAALPGLPADLEYRFLGGCLVIRDAKTNLIVDYLVVHPDIVAAGGP